MQKMGNWPIFSVFWPTRCGLLKGITPISSKMDPKFGFSMQNMLKVAINSFLPVIFHLLIPNARYRKLAYFSAFWPTWCALLKGVDTFSSKMDPKFEFSMLKILKIAINSFCSSFFHLLMPNARYRKLAYFSVLWPTRDPL